MLNLIRPFFFAVLVVFASMSFTVPVSAGDAYIVDNRDKLHDELTGEQTETKRRLYTYIEADRDTYTGEFSLFFGIPELPFMLLSCDFNGGVAKHVRVGFDFAVPSSWSEITLHGAEKGEAKILMKWNGGEVLTYENLDLEAVEHDRAVFVLNKDHPWLEEIQRLDKLIVRSYLRGFETIPEVTFFIDRVPFQFHGYVNRVLEGCGYQ